MIGIALNEDALLQTIKKKEVLNPGKEEPQYSGMVHVAFGVDENYAMSAGVAMTSLVIHNPDVPFCFHLFLDSLRAADYQRFVQFAEKHKTVVRIYYLDSEAFSALPTNGHITQATYYRLIIPLVLKDMTQRVLYLDSDITCLDTIKELIQYDLAGHVAAVVSDVDAMVAKRAAKLHLRGGRYFNAGFLYINIDEWNRQKISVQALNLFDGPLAETAYLDQDALNIVLEGKIIFLDRKWNYLYDVTYMTEKLKFPIAFLHYVGRVKPWKTFCRHEARNYYLQNAGQSQWADVAVEDPRTYREAKIYSRVLFQEGDWFGGVKWLFTYAYWKMRINF